MMNSLTTTIIGVFVIETSFFIAERIIQKKKTFSGILTTIILALIVLNFSFGNAVSNIFQHIFSHGNKFTLLDILLIFFNMFYGYWRGIDRIARINKKYGNL